MRIASVNRKTKETDIQMEFNLDGSGQYDVDSGILFLDHMLELFSRHGNFDLKLKARGDTGVDLHHTTEDVGIVLGQTFQQAIGEMIGIIRYASSFVPMDETLARVVIDISGRPCLVFQAEFPAGKVGDFPPELVREFFQAFANHAQLTLHIKLEYGENTHHMVEAIFKGFATALSKATTLIPGNKKIPSTKGML